MGETRAKLRITNLFNQIGLDVDALVNRRLIPNPDHPNFPVASAK